MNQNVIIAVGIVLAGFFIAYFILLWERKRNPLLCTYNDQIQHIMEEKMIKHFNSTEQAIKLFTKICNACIQPVNLHSVFVQNRH